MPTVIALTSFEHNGSRKRGAQFHISDHHAKQLVRAGLVEVKGSGADPSPAVGAKSSASPAVQASPQTTARKSRRGGRRKKAEASSSQTPRSD